MPRLQNASWHLIRSHPAAAHRLPDCESLIAGVQAGGQHFPIQAGGEHFPTFRFFHRLFFGDFEHTCQLSTPSQFYIDYVASTDHVVPVMLNGASVGSKIRLAVPFYEQEGASQHRVAILFTGWFDRMKWFDKDKWDSFPSQWRLGVLLPLLSDSKNTSVHVFLCAQSGYDGAAKWARGLSHKQHANRSYVVNVVQSDEQSRGQYEKMEACYLAVKTFERRHLRKDGHLQEFTHLMRARPDTTWNLRIPTLEHFAQDMVSVRARSLLYRHPTIVGFYALSAPLGYILGTDSSDDKRCGCEGFVHEGKTREDVRQDMEKTDVDVLFYLDDQFAFMPRKYGDAYFLRIQENATWESLNRFSRLWDPRKISEVYGKHNDSMRRFIYGNALLTVIN